MPRGHKKVPEIRSTECEVCDLRRQVDDANALCILTENMNPARPGAINVPGCVHFHAIRAANFCAPGLCPYFPACETIASTPREDPDVIPLAIIDVEPCFVTRETEAVGAIEVLGEEAQRICAGVQAIDSAKAHHFRPLIAIGFGQSSVDRVREEDVARARNHNVVWTIERLTLEVRREHLNPAVMTEPCHSAGRVLALKECACPVISQSVSLVSLIPEQGNAICRRPFMDPAVWDIGEQQVALNRVPQRALGERKAFSENLESRIEAKQIAKSPIVLADAKPFGWASADVKASSLASSQFQLGVRRYLSLLTSREPHI